MKKETIKELVRQMDEWRTIALFFIVGSILSTIVLITAYNKVVEERNSLLEERDNLLAQLAGNSKGLTVESAFYNSSADTFQLVISGTGHGETFITPPESGCGVGESK